MDYKNITELRKIARLKGIKNVYAKNEANLLYELEIQELEIKKNKEPVIEPIIEDNTDDIKDVDMGESQQLQKSGWYVFAIYVKDNQTRHKLKRVSVG